MHSVEMYRTLLQESGFFNHVIKGLQQESMEKKYEGYKLRDDSLLLYKNMMYVPNSTNLRHLILDEFHRRPYVGHLGY